MDETQERYLLWLILTLSISFYCYEFFLRISPSVMVGALMQYFQLNAFGMSRLLALYYIAYVLGQIPAGLILDRYPITLVLGTASLFCALGLYFFIESNTLFFAKTGRFLVGFASSFAFVAVLKIGRVYLPSQYFTRIVGITVALGTLIASYGNVFATALNMATQFKNIFYISIVFGFGLSLLFLFFYWVLPEHPHERKFRVHHFTVSELLKLIKNPWLWLNGLVGGLFYLPTAVLADVWGDYFLHSQYHFSIQQSSYSITWLFMGWMLGSPLMGYCADRYKMYKGLISFNALLSAFILMIMILFPYASFGLLNFMMLLLGLSSSAQLIVWRIFHQIAPFNLAATGIALTNMIIMLTCGLGQFATGFFLSLHQKSHDINLYVNADYRNGLILLPAALLTAAILARLLPQTHPTKTPRTFSESSV